MDYETLVRKLENAGVRTAASEPLSKHSSFGIGGAAALAVFPKNAAELACAVTAAAGAGVKYTVVGNCSNILFSDSGYRGAVIFTSNCRGAEINGLNLTAECGHSLTALAVKAKNASLTGLEFSYGIPGTVGGAVCMNAGAYGGDMSQVLTGCRCCDAASGRVFDISVREMQLGYRKSVFSENPELVVLGAYFRLSQGNADEIEARMEELMLRRREKQPLEYPSAGSTFKRPAGNFAGKLIEDCGLKGCKIGGAQVSEKHAGFVINRGGATCADVCSLIELIKARVLETFGVALECEIKIID